MNFPITQREIEQISASSRQQHHRSTAAADDISNDRRTTTTLAYKSFERKTKSSLKSAGDDNQHRDNDNDVEKNATTTGCISNSNTSGHKDTQRVDKEKDDDDGAVTNERYKSQYENIDSGVGGGRTDGCRHQQQKTYYKRNRRIEKVGNDADEERKPAAASPQPIIIGTWCTSTLPPEKYCQR